MPTPIYTLIIFLVGFLSTSVRAQDTTATVHLAFHFVGLPDGRNFVADRQDTLVAGPNGSEKLHAGILMWYLTREMNHRFRTALLDTPGQKDTGIRFAYHGGNDPLKSAYFYAHDERVDPLPDALNIVFRQRTFGKRYKSGPTGSTRGGGSNVITIYNRLPAYLDGSHDTWTVARTLGHEFGHTLGLDHTFKCDNPCAGQGFDPMEECYGDCVNHNFGSDRTNCYGGSQRQLLMAYGEDQLYLTPCEHELMWGYLREHQAEMPWVRVGP